MAEPKSHIQHRNNNDGRFITERKAERMPPNQSTRERVPNSGHGDTGRYDKKK